MRLSGILSGLILLTTAPWAFAECTFLNQAHSGSLMVHFDDITVSSATVVGDVLATGSFSVNEVASALNTPARKPFMHCTDGNETWLWSGTSFSSQIYDGKLYLDSGIEGIAIRLRNRNAAPVFSGGDYPGYTTVPGKLSISPADIGQLEVALVKVADVTGNGIISSGSLMKINIPGQGTDVFDYRINSFNVLTGGCEVDTKEVSVELGNTFAGHFSSAGNTQNETPFHIGIVCNSASLTPVITFKGTTDGDYPTVFSNRHGDGYARNIGVQVLKDGDIIVPGQVISLSKTGASLKNIDFSARLFRVNGPVIPGAIDVPVIFTVYYD